MSIAKCVVIKNIETGNYFRWPKGAIFGAPAPLIDIAFRVVQPGWYRRLVLDKEKLDEAGSMWFASTQGCVDHLIQNAGLCLIEVKGYLGNRQLQDCSRLLTVSERSILSVLLADVIVKPNSLIPRIEESLGV